MINVLSGDMGCPVLPILTYFDMPGYHMPRKLANIANPAAINAQIPPQINPADSARKFRKFHRFM